MKFSEMKAAVKTINMFNLLADHSIQITKDNMMCCLFHNEKTPSAKVFDEVIYCHGMCDKKTKNVIDVYMQLNNISDFKSAVEEMYSRYISADPETYRAAPGRIAATDEAVIAGEKEKIDSFTQADRNFKPYDTLNESEKQIVHSYFNSRCIPHSVENLKRNGYDVGINKSYKSNIMYKLNDFYLIRGDKGFKGNGGTPTYTPLKAAVKSQIWYIVEGIADALSVFEIDNNANVICLNSTANISKFIKSIEPKIDKMRDKYIFILLLDHDEAGAAGTQKLFSFFSSYEIDVIQNSCLIGTGCKDLNEFLMREGARSCQQLKEQ